jgi:ferredoxin
MSYQTTPSAAGEIISPNMAKRQFVVAFILGTVSIPLIRLHDLLGANWNPGLIRPPGALPEEAFLSRCIKCSQCMRICPTNVIHPAGLEAGLEGVWTPILNFRIGTSGCQLNCIACGDICPTAAIRPLRLEERLGVDEFAERGPVKIGTAFVDRGRCLPWAMNKPCIVCQENCPVSPKAIFTREHYSPVRLKAVLRVKASDATRIELEDGALQPEQFSTGDYYCLVGTGSNATRHRIIENTTKHLVISGDNRMQPPPPPETQIQIQIWLQLPLIDPQQCIGCGVCEHECPVRGRPAIRVSAENESRERNHALLL